LFLNFYSDRINHQNIIYLIYSYQDESSYPPGKSLYRKSARSEAQLLGVTIQFLHLSMHHSLMLL